MLELREISQVLSGVSIKEEIDGRARVMRLADLSDLKAGRTPTLATGDAPAVARALTIDDGDLIVGARGAATDVYVANEAIVGAFISLDLYLVRPNPQLVNPHYLAAFLELPSTQALFTGGKQGTGLSRLAKVTLEGTEIPLPPMRKQRLIAELSQTFRSEAALLTRLADLNSTLGREAVARAFRVGHVQPETTRSNQ
jgi:Type I restriction modification DNA specificity domain